MVTLFDDLIGVWVFWDCRNGTWNEGGSCDTNTTPETEYKKMEAEPPSNLIISDILKQMETNDRKVQLLNISYLTEFRKDGHPSSHREPGTPPDAPQDCSHWCLPGVPDTWNHLLYAHLVSKGFRTKLKRKAVKIWDGFYPRLFPIFHLLDLGPGATNFSGLMWSARIYDD